MGRCFHMRTWRGSRGSRSAALSCIVLTCALLATAGVLSRTDWGSQRVRLRTRESPTKTGALPALVPPEGSAGAPAVTRRPSHGEGLVTAEDDDDAAANADGPEGPKAVEIDVEAQLGEIETLAVTPRTVLPRTPCPGRALRPPQTTVHVVAVCTGATAARMAITMFKSILYRRTDPLRLHIIADDEFADALTSAAREWALPELEIVLYDAEECFRRVEWVPNVHYSGRNGLLKLVIHEILPADVRRGVVLDTDLLVLADIGALYDSLDAAAQPPPCIAMADNLSDWYLGTLPVVRFPWPALGRGLNTGVSVVDLDCLRRIHWTEMWHAEAERQLAQRRRVWPDEPRLYAAQLADQDIVNAMIASDVRGVGPGAPRLRDIVRRLPCEWNLQLGDNADPWRCLGRAANETDAVALRRASIVHWNSRKKTGASGDAVAQMRARYGFYANMGPDVLQERAAQLVCERRDGAG